MKKLLLALLLLAGAAQAQISNAPALLGQKGTSTPATCQVGQLFFDTNAAAGSNVFGCTSANTWTLMGGGGDQICTVTGTLAAGDIIYATSDTECALLNGSGVVQLNSASAPTAVTTLTGYKITKRVTSIATAASITPNADTTDLVTHTNTEGAGTLTVNAPSGTPTDAQALVLRIKCTNAQTFSFNAIYRASGDLALPASCESGSKWRYLAFMYNSGDTKWDYTGGAGTTSGF